MNYDSDLSLVTPLTNRGSLNTTVNGLRSLVDWVQVTFVSVNEVRKIIDLFGLSDVDFKETTGDFGYGSALRYNNISFYFNGRADMGIHVQLTGQGCREFELMKIYTWAELFQKLILVGGKFTRLDIAIDDIATEDRKLYFKISALERKLKRGLCKSKMRRARNIEDIDISTGQVEGQTLYFGKPSSRLQIRFYEKDFERRAKGYDLDEDITGWNRTELQLRKERADITAGIIASDKQPLGDVISGLLKNYVNFLSENDKDKNKSRKDIAPFWLKFLGDVEPIRISEVAPDKTIEQTKDHLKRQYKKTLAKVVIADKGKLDFIEELIKEGSDDLDDKDEKIIRLHWDNQEKHEKHLKSIERKQKKELPLWVTEAKKKNEAHIQKAKLMNRQ